MQGFGLGFLFIPLQMVAFATLPVMLRTDGASLFSLARNIGAAIGVSVTSSHAGAQHPDAACRDRRARQSVQPRPAGWGAVQQHLDPATRHGAAHAGPVINQQAQIIAYMDDYKMMIFTTLPALLLLFLMRRPRQTPRPGEQRSVRD